MAAPPAGALATSVPRRSTLLQCTRASCGKSADKLHPLLLIAVPLQKSTPCAGAVKGLVNAGVAMATAPIDTAQRAVEGLAGAAAAAAKVPIKAAGLTARTGIGELGS